MLHHNSLSRLKIVCIGQSMSGPSLERFGRRIRDAFRNVIEDIRIVFYDPPPFEEIETALLTRCLDVEVGGHVLGVTQADLLDTSGRGFFKYMFGGKDNSNNVAVVSTRRLAGRNSEVAGARILKVALHELGHNFGLVHHYSYEKNPEGSYCPMSKGDYNRFGERGYVRAVIDPRGFTFCHNCREFLRARYL